MTTLAEVNWYLLVLIVLAVTAAVSAVISLAKIEIGHKLFWRQLSMSLLSSAFIPAFIWFFKPNAPLWILLLVPISLWFSYRALFRVMSVRPMRLTLRTSLPENAFGLRVGHLSDLHICQDATMEGSIPAKAVLDAVRSSLKWVMEKSPEIGRASCRERV